jgi:protein-tyrosine phosphatase
LSGGAPGATVAAMASAPPSRLVALEGCLNFRDLGGYPAAGGRRLRWRLVYRSDGLQRLTAADVARLRGERALDTVIDLRSSAELRAEGRGPLAAEPVRFHHVPLFDGDVGAAAPAGAHTLADRYVLLAEFAREPIARVIAALADAPGPAVYHCAAGKDRTGVVSAVLLGLLDVPEEIIVADYVATRANLDAIVGRLATAAGYRAVLAALPPDTLHAEPETMVAFLAAMRARHGSLRGYARWAGVPDATVARLAARLVE